MTILRRCTRALPALTGLLPFLLLLLLLPPPARAQGEGSGPPAAPARPSSTDTVTVGVRVIRASPKGKPHLDEKLKDLTEQLATMPFKVFKLTRDPVLGLKVGGTGTVDLPGGHTLAVTPRRVYAAEGEVRLDINLKVAKLLDTDLTVREGGTFLSVVQAASPPADATVLAVTARTGPPPPTLPAGAARP
jgi:hypothetical protein